MVLYEIAFTVAAILFAVLGCMQHVMRQQVHHARFGNQEMSPWDVRYSNPLFGQYGIWTLHKRAYERSGLRSSFVGHIDFAACISSRRTLRFALRAPRIVNLHCC
jgi:hypothetical protein